MLILITGGSGSGKSAYAETYMTTFLDDSKKYYIATMQVFDQEGQKKIERHRQMRKGKGFVTIEQPVLIEAALEKIEESEQGKKSALLECISNLTANEMFCEESPKSCEFVTEKIIRGVQKLNEGIENLVIVTNNVFEDGIVYDETTMEYLKAMGSINEKLAAMADKVVEVVVGIPVTIKEGN